MSISTRRILQLRILAILLMTAVPAAVQAQGRGWGRDHDRWNRCGRFVNCHDARDGRWYGRGPRRIAFGRAIFISPRHRYRHFDHFSYIGFRRHRYERIRYFRTENRFGRGRTWSGVRWVRR
jgi:hypothetical protein